VMFDDLIEANRRYRTEFPRFRGVAGVAAKGLAVLTCIDFTYRPAGHARAPRRRNAKIIRNAGARVTPDALRSLVLAANLLGVTRVCVVQHTECAMVGSTDEELRAADRSGAWCRRVGLGVPRE